MSLQARRAATLAAMEARYYLEPRGRLCAGRASVWERVVGLMADSRARVEIVYVEAPSTALRARNRTRRVPIPSAVLDRLLDRWEVPGVTEAHEVAFAVPPGQRLVGG